MDHHDLFFEFKIMHSKCNESAWDNGTHPAEEAQNMTHFFLSTRFDECSTERNFQNKLSWAADISIKKQI